MSAHAPIVTLTMNPALDVSSETDRVEPEHGVRCGPSRFDPGGGGVNVTRAIRNLGGSSVAIYPLGGPTGQAYRGFIEADGRRRTGGHDRGEHAARASPSTSSTGEQYRFVLGPDLPRTGVARLPVGGRRPPVGGFLVASGSPLPGVPDDFYALLARIAASTTSGWSWMPRGPRRGGARRGRVPDQAEPRRARRPRRRRPRPRGRRAGGCRTGDRGRRAPEVVALTLGAAGAVLVTAEAVLRRRRRRSRSQRGRCRRRVPRGTRAAPRARGARSRRRSAPPSPAAPPRCCRPPSCAVPRTSRDSRASWRVSAGVSSRRGSHPRLPGLRRGSPSSTRTRQVCRMLAARRGCARPGSGPRGPDCSSFGAEQGSSDVDDGRSAARRRRN